MEEKNTGGGCVSVEAIRKEHCDFCDGVHELGSVSCKWMWASYEKGFAPMAEHFFAQYAKCTGLEFDTSKWSEVITLCEKCEQHRLKVIESADRIDKKFSKLGKLCTETGVESLPVMNETLEELKYEQDINTHN